MVVYHAGDVESNIDETDGKKIKWMKATNVRKVSDSHSGEVIVIQDGRLGA